MSAPIETAITGWIERLEKLNAILERARTTAEAVIGPSVQATADEGKQPGCSADRLTDELTTAIRKADCLEERVTAISEKF